MLALPPFSASFSWPGATKVNMFTSLQHKLLNLAFDPRTAEQEAIVAFLMARKSINYEMLVKNSSPTSALNRETIIQNIPHNAFFACFKTIHDIAKNNNILVQVQLTSAKENPSSALCGDLVIRYQGSESNNRVMNAVAKDIVIFANEVIAKRRQMFKG